MSDRDSTSTRLSDQHGPYRTRWKGDFRSPEPRWKRWTIALLGVIAPLVVLGIELGYGWCKEILFDPLPNSVHVFLVALVPLANALALSWRATRFAWVQRALNGAALAVSSVYALIFLPLMPLSFLAILMYGLGLLSLSPAFALLATLLARSLIAKRTALDPAPKFAPRVVGALAALVFFGAAALPHLLTQHGLRLATSSDPVVAEKGRTILRRFATTDQLLSTCALNIGRHTGSPLTLSLFGDPVSAEAAAEVFYRVTGRVCATRETDAETGFRTRTFATLAEDPEGPDRATGVELASSRFDASVDARAGVAYLEWTLVLKNANAWQAEATAELELPKNAVISRATLWIDGEPREAAFASRSLAREAYERVVSGRRDPLLVTNTGRGRAQFRCFPVPPHGEMKILLGISAPLSIESPNVALLGLPSVLRRNFSQQSSHRLWVEAKQPFQLAGARAQAVAKGWTLDQRLPAPALEPADLVLRFDRNGANGDAWSADPSDESHLITQRVESYRATPIAHLSIVLDASLRQRQAAAVLRAALANVAPGTELSVIVASDAEAVDLASDRRVEPALLGELDAALSKLSFEGGADNVPALIRAVERASQKKAAAVLWLHGPQPYLYEQPERVRQVLERAAGRLSLFELQTALGRNRVIEALEGAPGFTNPARTGDLDTTLRHQFKEWSGGVLYRARRQREPLATSAAQPELKTSDHLTRLWAYEEVERLARERHREQAVALASAHKLVTSVSGAVVLETASQYTEAGLVPPTAENVPSVPEPAFWALIGCALGFLVLTLIFSRRLKNSEPVCG